MNSPLVSRFLVPPQQSYFLYEKDLSGLQAFCADYPEAIPILLYNGQERLVKKNIYCLPIDDFLKKLTPLHGKLF